jgi:hypothetical protein
MAWMELALPIKDRVAGFVTCRALQLCRMGAAMPRVLP